MNNPIIDEVRDARASLAAEHDYDRHRILEWAKKEHAARRKSSEGQNKPVVPTGASG